MKMIKVMGIVKTFRERIILDGLNLTMTSEESIAITGRSGSGKTTLINILIGMDTDYVGEYYFDSDNLTQSSSFKRTKFRRHQVGIITQHFDLLEDRNVAANIAISLTHLKLSRKERRERIEEVLEYVGLKGMKRKSIKQLSGGEKQRIGIARALAKRPRLIVADEPTGALDEETRDQILELFKKMMKDGQQFIIVTHDEQVAKICAKTYHLRKGILQEVDGSD